MALSLFLISLLAFITTALLGVQLHRSRAARNWSQHPATVLESTVTPQWTRYGTLYKLTVRCEYVVGHRRMVTEAMPSVFGTHRAGYVRRLADFFRLRATVPVYVDPQRPHVAVLLPGIDGRQGGMFALMLVCAVSTLVGAFSI